MTLHFSEESGATGKTTKSSYMVKRHFVRVNRHSLIDQAIEFESGDPAFSGTKRMLWSLEPENDRSTLVRVEAHNAPSGIPADRAKGLHSPLENLARWPGPAHSKANR